MPRKHHELKLAPQFFSEMQAGRKNSEFRLNDRNFEVGDTLELREWIPPPNQAPGTRLTAVHGYTGRSLHREISHVLTRREFEPLPEDWAVLSLRPIDPPDNNRVEKLPVVTEGDIDPTLPIKDALSTLADSDSPLREVVVAGWRDAAGDLVFYYASSVGNAKASLILQRATWEILFQTEKSELGGSRYLMSDNNEQKP